MFVPIIVPSHSGGSSRSRMPTIINKTIIYQDTVLDLKDKGGNLSVTKIEVKIEDFEECLNIIFESNPDVVFNTVQYSHKNEEAIFYTDRKISTEKWEKRDERTFKPVTKAATLLETVEQVLEYEDILQSDCISAFSVWLVYKEVDEKEQRVEKIIEGRISSKIKSIDHDYYISFHGFDYDKNEVHLSVNSGRWKDFYFRKNQGDLYLHKQDRYVSFDILSLIGSDIEEYYDYCYDLREIKHQHLHNVNSVNSPFYCDFMKSCVHIDEMQRTWHETFTVEALVSSKKFTCECNSNNIHEMLRGKENEFAKKVFVKISDCPKWMQEKLYEIRKQQIEQIQNERIAKEKAEKEKAEQERIIREKIERKLARKQKRRQFWKKIFPFIK